MGTDLVCRRLRLAHPALGALRGFIEVQVQRASPLSVVEEATRRALLKVEALGAGHHGVRAAAVDMASARR